MDGGWLAGAEADGRQGRSQGLASFASLYCCKRMTIEYRSSSRCTILRVAGLS